MNKTKRIISISALAIVLIVGGSAAVYAQYSEPNSPDKVKISASDYKRMSDIVIAVNNGELPVSALKDAEPVLKLNPEIMSQKVRAEYNALK